MGVKRRPARHEVIILFADPEDLRRWGSTALTLSLIHISEPTTPY